MTSPKLQEYDSKLKLDLDLLGPAGSGGGNPKSSGRFQSDDEVPAVSAARKDTLQQALESKYLDHPDDIIQEVSDECLSSKVGTESMSSYQMFK